MNDRTHWLAATCMLIASCASTAPAPTVPDLPAAQNAYRRELDRLAAAGHLDWDAVLAARVQRILARLGRTETARGHGATRPTAWEVHVVEADRIEALSVPGGKLVVGGPFLRALQLDDGEIAMVLAHEMAHFLAGHRRIIVGMNGESTVDEDAKQAAIAKAQELDADAMGIDLVVEAGWPLQSALSFFRKLVTRESAGSFSPTHPAARVRLERALAHADSGKL